MYMWNFSTAETMVTLTSTFYVLWAFHMLTQSCSQQTCEEGISPQGPRRKDGQTIGKDRNALAHAAEFPISISPAWGAFLWEGEAGKGITALHSCNPRSAPCCLHLHSNIASNQAADCHICFPCHCRSTFLWANLPSGYIALGCKGWDQGSGGCKQEAGPTDWWS